MVSAGTPVRWRWSTLVSLRGVLVPFSTLLCVARALLSLGTVHCYWCHWRCVCLHCCPAIAAPGVVRPAFPATTGVLGQHMRAMRGVRARVRGTVQRVDAVESMCAVNSQHRSTPPLVTGFVSCNPDCMIFCKCVFVTALTPVDALTPLACPAFPVIPPCCLHITTAAGAVWSSKC